MSYDVSFIIPCYNEASYVVNCIASIRQQEIDPAVYEIIVVDNGSIDGTEEIAASLGAKVLINPRRGAAASRNFGASFAKGHMLAFVDADCILDSKWFITLAAHFLSPQVCAVAAPAIPVSEGITWVERAWSKVFVCFPRNVLHGVARVTNLASSNLLIRAEHFKNIGGFDEKLLSCEDYDLSQRLLHHGILLLDNNILVSHLRESKTIRELFNREVARGRYSLRCFKKNGFALGELPSAAIPIIFVCVLLTSVAIMCIQTKIAILLLSLLLCMPMIYIVRSGMRFETTTGSLQEYIVVATYIVARSIAMIKEIYDICTVPWYGTKGVG